MKLISRIIRVIELVDTNLRRKHDRWKRGVGVEPTEEGEAPTSSSVALIFKLV